MPIREPAAGELNRRITLRIRGDVPADDYGLASVFSGERQRWAKIEPVGTAVYVAGVQIDAKVTHRITFRFIDGLGSAHEVLHGSKIYRVRRVTDLNGTHRFTSLEVEELGLLQSGEGIYGE